MGMGRSGLKVLKKKLGLNTENKNYDLAISGTTSGTLAALFYPTNALAQGSTNNTRSGNSLRITHWKMKGGIYTSTLNGQGQRVRIIATYQPKMSTPGTEVTNTQLLQTNTDVDSFYKTDLQDCQIIYDKTYTLTPQYSNQQVVLPFKFHWRPSYDHGHVIWTDADTTGVTANVVAGLLKVFILTDQAANFAFLTGRSRVYFVDN